MSTAAPEQDFGLGLIRRIVLVRAVLMKPANASIDGGNSPPEKPVPPPSKIGNKVVFSPPLAVGDAPKRKGEIVDEVWTEIYPDKAWGWYIYTSQLIKWADGSRSIRMTYYYHPEGGARWIFGGQYSLEDTPDVIHGLIRDTLVKNWK